MTRSRHQPPGKHLIYWHPARNPAPRAITEASAYRGEADLCVHCTQLPAPYTPRQQRDVVRAWCELLSRPTPVRRL
jgi:hypothetical protein